DRRLGADELSAALVLFQNVAQKRARKISRRDAPLQRAIEEQRLVRREHQLPLEAISTLATFEQQPLAGLGVVARGSETLVAEKIRHPVGAQRVELRAQHRRVDDVEDVEG